MKDATSENRHRGCRRDVGADCSKYGQQQQGTPESDQRWWTAVYDGHSATMTKQIEGVSGPRNQPRVLELISEIRRCCPKQILVHENSKLELNPLRCSQPVQLPEKQSDAAVPRRREHEPTLSIE